MAPIRSPIPARRAVRRRLPAAAAAGCAVALVVVLAGCGGGGGGSSTSVPAPPDTPGVARYEAAGNAICSAAAKRIAPVSAKVRSAEAKASLADVRAVVAATTQLRTRLARLTPPPVLRAAHRRMLARYREVVVRLRHDLATEGSALFQDLYKDSTLGTLGARLGDSWTELGLSACRTGSG